MPRLKIGGGRRAGRLYIANQEQIMSFQIHALDPEHFSDYFNLSDEALAERKARRMTVTANPGFPCRVSLEDAEIGETVILLNHDYLPHNSPYQGRHAIFVRDNAVQARPGPGDIPAVLARRPLSVRAFDADFMMQAARIVDGSVLGQMLEELFENPDIVDIHIHNAGPGCYAARAARA